MLRQIHGLGSLPLVATPALASDGVIEIDQVCATTTGCVPGDAAGFPVTLQQAGSYRLTSNLHVSAPSVSAISILAQRVTLDLGGFEVSGPGSCLGLGGGIVCTGGGSGLAHGIDGSIQMGRVRNGSIRGFGGKGVDLYKLGRAESLLVSENAGGGVVVGDGGSETDVAADRNGDFGIIVSTGVVQQCAATFNRGRGIRAYFSVISGNVSDRFRECHSDPQPANEDLHETRWEQEEQAAFCSPPLKTLCHLSQPGPQLGIPEPSFGAPRILV